MVANGPCCQMRNESFKAPTGGDKKKGVVFTSVEWFKGHLALAAGIRLQEMV